MPCPPACSSAWTNICELGKNGVAHQKTLGRQGQPVLLQTDQTRPRQRAGLFLQQHPTSSQGLHQGAGDPLGQAQSEHESLLQASSGPVRHPMVPEGEAGEKGLQIPGEEEPLTLHTGVGRWPQAQVVHLPPVFQVVAGDLAAPCKVGDLILGKALLLQLLHRLQVEVRLAVLVGAQGGNIHVGEGSPWLNF